MTALLTTLRLLFSYGPWLVWQLATATLVLARDVGTPGSTQRPRIVKLSVEGMSDLEVALLTSSITITPGTLVLGIAPPEQGSPAATFVQGLFGEDEEALMAGLEDMRRHVVAATRGRSRLGEAS